MYTVADKVKVAEGETMLWQWSPSVIAELAAAAILLVLAIYFPWRDLNRQARLTGVTLVFACALWILSHAIEIGLPVASYKEALVGLQLVLGMIALTFWLFYIFHYLGPRKFLTRRIYILFGIMPLIAILALSTNNVYGFMWSEVGLDSQNPYLPLQPTYGIIYWACMVYVAMLTLTGSLLIIWNIIRRSYSYSRESIYLLIAAVLPLITAFIEVLGLLSFLKLSVGLSSWTACIGAIILILNLPRFHLEQVIPVARDIIFERIGDCILVLDVQDRVLDLNPAAEQLTGYRIAHAFGLPIERIWPYHTASLMPFNKMADASEELVLERDGTHRDYNLRISSINDEGGILTGKVVLLTDITERKIAENALKESEETFKAMVETMPLAIYLSVGVEQISEYISPTMVKLFGYTMEDIPTVAKWWPLAYPDETYRNQIAEEWTIRIKRAIETRSSIESMETVVTCKDGSKKNVLWGYITMGDKNYAFGLDLTERKLSEENLVKSFEALKKTLNDAIDTMAKIVETRDPYTAGHQQRVAELATAIAREMKVEDIQIDNLRMAAVIHDIGKMYVPSDILSKPGKLSDIEYSLIKFHPQYGYDIVKGMDFPCNVAKVVLQHHERLDGSGYPNQLKGDDTLLEAKILTVADVIEAMASHRPYRPAPGIDKALEEISKNSGKLYDPGVVDACLELFKSGKFEFKSV
jgi:PAS domain S-box-containing protein/putative nucleotidyltransferase with HDIG domain